MAPEEKQQMEQKVLKDLCGIIRNICLVFVSGSWHGVPKSLGIFLLTGASYVNSWQAPSYLQVGCWLPKRQALIRILKLSVQLPKLPERWKVLDVDLVIEHAYLMMSLQPPLPKTLRVFCICEHVPMLWGQ